MSFVSTCTPVHRVGSVSAKVAQRQLENVGVHLTADVHDRPTVDQHGQVFRPESRDVAQQYYYREHAEYREQGFESLF